MDGQLLKTTDDELDVTIASPQDSARDEELVAAAKDGDELAFETIVKRHRQRISAVALRYTRSREDAEDIVRQAFQKAFIHLQSFEGRSSFYVVDEHCYQPSPDVAAETQGVARSADG